MNTFLLILLSLSGLLALYWVLIGQWKHNAMMRQDRNDNAAGGGEVEKNIKNNSKSQD